MKTVEHITILGAGPTGLGAAHRLHSLGMKNWDLYEQNAWAGGLAASFVDQEGFTWDIGGHVQFSHYQYFDRLMDELLGEEWLYHERESWVRIYDRFVPYPFQNNIRHLPTDKMWQCIKGLMDARENHKPAPVNFEEWMLAVFGEGIVDIFMRPYNFKVWAYPPRQMDFSWIGDRVAVIDLKRVLENIFYEKDDVNWGPNNRFKFPAKGGTGEIWKRLAQSLPGNRVHYNKQVLRIDTRRKQIYFSDGSVEPYHILISTIPLNQLVEKSDLNELVPLARKLKFSSTHIVGLGMMGQTPPHLKTKCWMYFPEKNSPFYRATVFSNYSPNNVPDAAKHWSLMCEISESEHKPVNQEKLVDETIQGAINSGLLTDSDIIISTWHHREPQGYPTPFLGRDTLINKLLQGLQSHDIYSRGRFGAWKYEVSNQDHSLMQGVECVNHLLFQNPEITLNYPQIVNGR